MSVGSARNSQMYVQPIPRSDGVAAPAQQRDAKPDGQAGGERDDRQRDGHDDALAQRAGEERGDEDRRRRRSRRSSLVAGSLGPSRRRSGQSGRARAYGSRLLDDGVEHRRVDVVLRRQGGERAVRVERRDHGLERVADIGLALAVVDAVVVVARQSRRPRRTRPGG